MKTRGKSSIILIICTLAIFLAALIGARGVELGGYRIKSFDELITKGLDLQGGVSVLMEIQEDTVTSDDLEKTKSQLELRVNKIGVSETVIATEGDRRIRIDIPGAFNSSEIVDSLKKTGVLTFRSPEGDILLTGQDVEDAKVTFNQETSKPEITLKMNESGKTKFAEATTKYVGKVITIYMDEDKLTEPTVENAITDGTAVISGKYTAASAKNLAGLINSGALPVTLKDADVKTVGAELGADALPNALTAAVVGIGLIFLFMTLYYRVPGVLSCIVLVLYVVLVLLIMQGVGVTLTLPGIAALLLTVGMAVDANVLIYSRIREELRKGITIKSAIEKGFDNALSSIVDSNVTTIIAALVLYFLGNGSVKGFAVTLMIGILTSLFTALIVTKFFMRQAVKAGLLNKLSHFRVQKGVK